MPRQALVADSSLLAAAMEADAVVGIRFSSSMVMQGAAEILAYGTAVRLAPASSAEPSGA